MEVGVDEEEVGVGEEEVGVGEKGSLVGLGSSKFVVEIHFVVVARDCKKEKSLFIA